ncbi:MAG: c-type cytochrome [Pseudomonadota bacterium]
MRLSVLCLVGCCVLAPAALAQATPDGLDGFVTMDRLPVPADPVLRQGREVWGDTCENCHGGNKLTGAPKITSTEAWAPRITQEMDTLFAHAIEGFVGPKYAQMPARGGNPTLSDAEVRAAVAFMVWASGGDAVAEAWAMGADKKE